ncbi:hypothetical protein SAZ11_49110 [Streptomyces sp. FXJ1.4098]|nr:hypothetical protein [Streptomyces sp. FXJ1.4098]
MHAEVPADMTAADHGRLLEDHGPAPAPGYIWSPLSEDETSLAELLDKTDRISSQMAELGLFHADITERGRAESWTYRQTVPAGLWAEPGHTSVDIPATVAALPDTFDGWLVIEVDRGAQATPEEGVRLCGEWAQQAY